MAQTTACTRRVAVTGASGGIGAALAIVFHHGVIGQGVGQSQLPAAGFQWLLQRNSRTFTPNFSQFHS